MKSVYRFVGILMLLLLLVACGNESEGGKSSGEDNDKKNTSSDEVYKIRVSHSAAATGDRLENALQEFKKAVEERSDGKIVIETYPNSQLGGEREQLEGVQMGTNEMAVTSTAPYSGFFDKMTILDLPYVFESAELQDRVLDGEFGDQLFELLLEETGIRGLSWGDNGVRHIANNSRSIEKPEDVKGLKIRTQENQAHMDMITEFGGSPTPMPFPELYSSLQQGVIDGYENPFSLIESMRFYEVTEYISLTSHVRSALAFVVNDDYFTGLPEDVQTILAEEARNWSEIERQMERDQDAEGMANIEEYGVEILELTDEQLSAFEELANPIVEKYAEKIGMDLYQDLLDAIEKEK